MVKGQVFVGRTILAANNDEKGGKFPHMMNSTEFTQKALNIARNVDTVYTMGGFGAPLTDENKQRYINGYSYNSQPIRRALIERCDAGTFGFDCCGLIKGILWGFSEDRSKRDGGSKYASNGVPDINADQMISNSHDVSSDFTSTVIIPGELVWKPGHIGIYVGGGLVVECSPAYSGDVQITAIPGLCDRGNMRAWDKHGKFNYVDYADFTGMCLHPNGEMYWYEYGERQGTINDPLNVVDEGFSRGREIYDYVAETWRWLDRINDGKVATSKYVYIPYRYMWEKAGETEGKWVWYDSSGRMARGWMKDCNDGSMRHFDETTGAMDKGLSVIDGKLYCFDPISGSLVSKDVGIEGSLGLAIGDDGRIVAIDNARIKINYGE